VAKRFKSDSDAGVVERACPMMRLPPSCRATRHGFLWR
jgi:hypothetical protein